MDYELWTTNYGLRTHSVPHVMRRVLQMLREQIRAPVSVEVSPDRVNVVRVVLRVVVFDQKRRTLDAIVVPLPARQAAHPGELHSTESGQPDAREPRLRERFRLRARVLVDERQQQTALLAGEVGVRDPEIRL